MEVLDLNSHFIRDNGEIGIEIAYSNRTPCPLVIRLHPVQKTNKIPKLKITKDYDQCIFVIGCNSNSSLEDIKAAISTKLKETNFAIAMNKMDTNHCSLYVREVGDIFLNAYDPKIPLHQQYSVQLNVDEKNLLPITIENDLSLAIDRTALLFYQITGSHGSSKANIDKVKTFDEKSLRKKNIVLALLDICVMIAPIKNEIESESKNKKIKEIKLKAKDVLPTAVEVQVGTPVLEDSVGNFSIEKNKLEPVIKFTIEFSNPGDDRNHGINQSGNVEDNNEHDREESTHRIRNQNKGSINSNSSGSWNTVKNQARIQHSSDNSSEDVFEVFIYVLIYDCKETYKLINSD
jgi:hypothetical protein